MPSVNRYENRNTPDQQMAANARYREKQRNARNWLDEVATDLGLTRDQLVSSPAGQVAQLLRTHFNS
ncbi:hypothetical protein HMPREF3169_05245 [Corynebacterium sp. HMSC08C04]|uniref:hypothetical protein n=1 Tax=Corynebacterium sp. HMSC08C04 TaxID=1581137 RepID=UPI0008A4E62E|nr:hypothetical protein [Corynebacterium sp. HMSC08C04]OFT34649.1 hypothetical protein HMPREF3169_05245 [Corynebacterium sp. HMSC08C04]